MTGDFIFIRCDLSDKYHLHDAITFLEKKHGYSKRTRIQNIEIYCFGKQKNLHDFMENNIIFFGFMMYKGLFNIKAVKLLLDESNPDWIKVKGDFCILQIVEGQYKIILDPLRKFHVFQIDLEFVITSSFLGAGILCPKLSLNFDAIYERLARGYNIAPDTVFNEITQLYNPGYNKKSLIKIVNNILDFSKCNKYSDINQALNYQIGVIDNYFIDLKSFSENEGTDLGISSGLDSRLLLASILNNKYKNFQLHTHSIEGIQMHTFEKNIAKKIADLTGVHLKIINTKGFDQLKKEALDESIFDNFIYFDGRNSYNMGAFAPNYTQSYKNMIMNEKGISINGIGGEIFRNYYYTKHGYRNFKKFAENWLFYRYSKDYLGNSIFNRVLSNVQEKIKVRLNIDFDYRINLAQIRRYYSEIRMPDCDAINNNAHNRFYFFLTPYIEPEILVSGYGILPFLGYSTSFEGKLIKRMNKILSQIPTHYGKDALHKSILAQFKYLILATSPQELFRLRLNVAKWHEIKKKNKSEFISHLQHESVYINEVWSHFTYLFPKINYRVLCLDFACLANTLMLANTLYFLRDKLLRDERENVL